MQADRMWCRLNCTCLFAGVHRTQNKNTRNGRANTNTHSPAHNPPLAHTAVREAPVAVPGVCVCANTASTLQPRTQHMKQRDHFQLDHQQGPSTPCGTQKDNKQPALKPPQPALRLQLP